MGGKSDHANLTDIIVIWIWILYFLFSVKYKNVLVYIIINSILMKCQVRYVDYIIFPVLLLKWMFHMFVLHDVLT